MRKADSETVGVICLTVAAIAFMLLVFLTSGCHLHLHVGEKHYSGNEPETVLLETTNDEVAEGQKDDVGGDRWWGFGNSSRDGMD